LHAAEQDRPDVAAQRTAWRFWQGHLHAHRLVFIDETGANTKMTRTRGRALRGQRLVAKVPHGHWKTTTFVGALRATGFTAPLVIDGPMNAEIFLAYVKQELVPTLRRGDTVILDNLSSHKKAGVREAIEAAGASVVYLPPYSPDLNPIELAFAKLKSLLRQAAARGFDELQQTLANLIDKFSLKECLAYFRHCGYAAH
jgi:transposase